MKSAQIDYHITPGGAPNSFVHAQTFEDACDPGDIKHAWSFTDGLGRVRMTVSQGVENPVAPRTEWIASGYVVYDTKGGKQRVLDPAYIQSFSPTSPSLPSPVAESCPPGDDNVPVDAVCATLTRYDAFGRAVETVLPNGDTSRVEHRGPLETWAYDGNDTGASPASDPAFIGTPTKTRKDGHGRVIQTEVINVTKPHAGSGPTQTESYFTGYSYDGQSNLVSIRTCLTGDPWRPGDPAGCVEADRIEKIQTFDSMGQRRSIIDPDAGTWTFDYDASGNLTDSRDGKWNAPGVQGSHLRYVYDAANRLIQEICVECVNPADPANPLQDTVVASYFYDAPVTRHGGRGYMGLDPDPTLDEPQDFVLGRIARIEDQTGWVMFSYNRRGQQVTEAQHIDVLFSDGSAPLSGSADVYIGRAAYDDAGRVTKLTYPDPNPDPSATDPQDEPLEVYHAYNRRGLLAGIFGPDPLPTSATPVPYWYVQAIQYNAKGQRTRYEYGDHAQTLHQMGYDRNGRLHRKHVRQQVKAQSQQVSWPYDLLHREFHYDAASNITAITDLRDFAHVSEYTGGDNLPYDLEITYDGLSRVTKVRYQRKPAETTTGSQDPTLRREMRYAYNAVGNIIQRSTTDGNGTPNPAGEFYEKWLNTSATPAGQGSQGGDAITAPVNHPHAFGEVITDSGLRSVRATYDANGNMTELEVINAEPGIDRHERYVYTWDHYDRLVAVKKWDDSAAGPGPGGGPGNNPGGGPNQSPGGGPSPGAAPLVEAYYSYDTAGRRVAKSEMTPDDLERKDTLYITDGFELRNRHHLRYVTDGSQKVTRLGVASPNSKPASPLGSQPQPQPLGDPKTGPECSRLTIVGDHLGSTSLVVHDTAGVKRGTVASTISHLPYGGLESESNSLLTDGSVETETFYRFTGKELERGLGLYYFGARYYIPALTRWLNADPMYAAVDTDEITARDALNRYSYSADSPIKFYDPSGSRVFLGYTVSPANGNPETREGRRAIRSAFRKADFDRRVADRRVQALSKLFGPQLKGAASKYIKHKRGELVLMDPAKVRWDKGAMDSTKALYKKIYHVTKGKDITYVGSNPNLKTSAATRHESGSTFRKTWQVKPKGATDKPRFKASRFGMVQIYDPGVNLNQKQSESAAIELGRILAHEIAAHEYPFYTKVRTRIESGKEVTADWIKKTLGHGRGQDGYSKEYNKEMWETSRDVEHAARFAREAAGIGGEKMYEPYPREYKPEFVDKWSPF
jgi:RHS repeat-associated protein